MRRISEAYDASVSAIAALTDADFQELGTYDSPPSAVRSVLAAVCTVLGASADWDSALDMLHDPAVALHTRIQQFDVASLRQPCLSRLAQLAAVPEMSPDHVKIVSHAAYYLALWVHAVVEHGKVESVLQWERSRLQEEMQRRDATQVTFHP